MTSRGASASVIAEVAKNQNRPIHLVQVIFDSTTFYLTDAYRNIIWDGHTYLMTGHFMGISDISETATLQVSSVTLSLSGVDQAFISQFLNYDYTDRQVLVYRAWLDDSEAVISSPVLWFDGRMDEPVIDEDPETGKCIVAVTCANHFVDFEKQSGRYTNHESQQIFYPGDKGFSFASEIVTDIVWGKA
ncbi:MAG: hypothetical protein ABIL58_19945 [Pseudomonadota bacterium]